MEKRGLARFRAFLIAVLILAMVVFLGGLIFHKVEGWRYLDSVYFSSVTVLTIGYGDFTPQTDLGKILAIIFGFVGIAIALYVLGNVSKYVLHMHIAKSKKEHAGMKKDIERTRDEVLRVEKEIDDIDRTIERKRLGFK